MTVTDPQAQPVGPYATAAHQYLRAGFAPLPIPYGQKKPVPEGWTGNDGAWPSYADVQAWVEDRGGSNVGLRLPPNVLGLDTDHYGSKPGGALLAALEQRHGALPPTWRVTSRDDGQSGIRLYRIPEGLRWPGVLGPGIETLRYAHRYAVAWPSIHPDTQKPYRWITPDGAVSMADVPTVDELPALPQTWVDALTGGALATDQPRADLTDGATGTWLQERGQGAPCRVMNHVLHRGRLDLAAGGSRHDAALALSNRIAWLAGEGHNGGFAVLQEARQEFMHAMVGDRDDLDGEWNRMVSGAVRLAAAAHPNIQPDPCDDPFAGLIPKGTTTWTTATPTSSPPPTGASLTPSNASPTTSATPPNESATASSSTNSSPETTDDLTDAGREVATRLRPGGAFILDIPDHVPAVWGDGDHVLWAEGEALTICGPAGVGKTTLTGQVLRARLVGGEVLGFPVAQTSSKVLYLAMDRPRQIARALRRTLGDLPRDVLDERLVIWPGPPIADVAAHPNTLVGLAHLAGADTIIVDSIKDAAVGLSSDEVGAGYNRARQMCIAEGIEILEQHHMVKKGEKGARPNSLADLYGSVWIGAGSGSVLLLYGAAGDPIVDMTHLKTPAEEVGPWRLIHDHEHGTTSIYHQTDTLLSARLAGRRGLTAKQLACSIAEKENPTASEIEKARRQLAKLTEKGLLRVTDTAGQASIWHYVEDMDDLIAEPDISVDKGSRKGSRTHFEENAHVTDSLSRLGASSQVAGVTNGVTGVTQPGVTVAPSSLEEGGQPREDRSSRTVRRVVAGKEVLIDLNTGEVLQ